MQIKYRPEIDGLRAISVIAVIIYHARLNFDWYNLLQGGFIGVDIFFGGPAAPYALYVHEILYYKHNSPTQAKYLEAPFMERLPQIQQNLARRIMDLMRKNGAS